MSSTQMAFDWLPVVPVVPSHDIEADFRTFHRQNPHVYRILRQMARDYKRAGNDRCGMKMLWEVLRYTSSVQTAGEPYKLNNNFTALYARLLMEQEPDLRGFFETRERRA